MSSPPSQSPDRSPGSGILLTVLICGVLVVSGLIAFFITVRGEEETLVPNVVAADLLEALGMLQEKSLAPRVEGRISDDHAKWTVIEQEPAAGTLVKAGRPVLLVVSRGPIVDRVGDYEGRDLDEVRLELQTLFASYRELIKIQEPVARVTDVAAAGTVLAQNPPPNTPIDGVVLLELVVSKGPRGDLIELQNYVTRPFLEVRDELAVLNLPFVFRVRAAREGEAAGSIVSQSPTAGQEIPYSSILQLEMTTPSELPEGMMFGLLEASLPDYPILVDLRLEVITATETRVILAMKHPGGAVSIPYLVDADSQLVLSMFDDEILTRPAR
jgi:beta-lactam-binding protein with PASTA domain